MWSRSLVEELFKHKHVEENGDIIEARIWKVPKSERQPEGVAYSLAYIRKGKRIVGYDNHEAHKKAGSSHHKHVGGRIVPYEFEDEWKLQEDFADDVSATKDRIRRGDIP